MKSKHEWLIKGSKIGAMQALTHHITGEVSLFGTYGQIFLYNSTTCIARVFRMQRIPRPLGWLKGDEMLVKFHVSELNEWTQVIGMPPSIWGQKECAVKDRLINRSFK
jgi:hypothetical protein